MPYKQYTHCVQPADYQDLLPKGNIFGIIGSIITSGGLDEGSYAICDYLLGGKLVCLGGDRCAVGRITEFEKIKSSFPDSIDNDLCFNILLAPHELGEFANGSTAKTNYFAVAIENSGDDKPQGDLITEQTTDGQPRSANNALMPIPHDGSNSGDEAASDRYHLYMTDFPDSNYVSYAPNPSPVPPNAVGFSVPILHLECEGSRLNDICEVLTVVWGPISNTVCKIPLIGPLLCFILTIVLAPILLPLLSALLTTAWLNATDGNEDDPKVDSTGGPLELGDGIVVTGRWVFDAGHQGWNEFHPLKTVQRIPAESYNWVDFNEFLNRWCSLTSQVPPFDDPGKRPASMTPEQSDIYDRQREPENRWYLHPLVDGCQTDTQPPNIH